jgi:hypothetical protein
MPVTQFAFQEKYRYQNGFNSYHEYAISTPIPSYIDMRTGVKR